MSVANMAPAVKVKGFLPSTSGLHFTNSFPSAPLRQVRVGPVTIPLGDASNGLCGGMIFTVRDYFEAGLLLPAQTDPPSQGPLYDYMVDRLISSLNLPGGPMRYMALMSPYLPDGETWWSRHGLRPRGRAWVMINDEWPRIRSDIDGGKLSPLGLLLLKSHDPRDLGKNHQVLAYGYTLSTDSVTIFVYDPNNPNGDQVTITLGLGNPNSPTRVTSPQYSAVVCFFRTAYSFSTPPQQTSTPVCRAALRSSNGKYLCAEGGGGAGISANRDSIGYWETFVFERPGTRSLASKDQVNIKASNGNYVVAEHGGGSTVRADSSVPRQWERFVVLRLDGSRSVVGGEIQGGDTIALLACNDQFVVAEGGGGAEVNANRDAIGAWETFIITVLP